MTPEALAKMLVPCEWCGETGHFSRLASEVPGPPLDEIVGATLIAAVCPDCHGTGKDLTKLLEYVAGLEEDRERIDKVIGILIMRGTNGLSARLNASWFLHAEWSRDALDAAMKGDSEK